MNTADKPSSDFKTPREQSKARRLIDLLQTGTGASLEEMTTATGWQTHTVRAAMTGLRRRGYTITRNIQGNTAVWSIGTVA